MAWQFAEPRIRLEVLGKFQLTAVLGLTYFAVIVGLLSGLYELRLGTSYIERSGAQCSNTTIALTGPCTDLGVYHERWVGSVDNWSVFYGAFELLLSVAPQSQPPPLRTMVYDVVVFGARNEEDEGTWHVIRILENVERTLRCPQPPPLPCTDLLLFSRADISCFCRDKLMDFQRFKVVVSYHQPNPNLLGQNSTVTYYFIHRQVLYQTTQLVGRWALFVMTAVVLALYLLQHHAAGRGYPDLLPEQCYVIGLLVTTLAYQNPLHGMGLMGGSVDLLYWSQMLEAGAFSAMLVLFLLLFGSIKRHGRAQHTLDFYLPKIIFGTLLWCVDAVLQTLKMTIYDPDVQYSEQDGADAICIAILGYAKVALLLLWVVWVLSIWVSTSRHLQKYPYLKTRFRQLPFRYFVLQGWCVLVFLVITAVYNIAHSPIMDLDSGQNLLGVVLIVSVYNCLLAYVYSPPYPHTFCSCRVSSQSLQTYSSNDISPGVQDRPTSMLTTLQQTFLRAPQRHTRRQCAASYSPLIARWLFCYSLQAYYDVPDKPTSSGWGPVEEWVDVVDFISDGETDTHVLLANKNGRLIVAFRGSSSRCNWANNFRFKQVALPCDINPTTRLSGLFPPCVHIGFWDAYQRIREALLLRIQEYVEQHKGTQIYITGHSLGGALGTFAAYDVTLQLGQEVQLYNYGSPRVGNHFWVLYYDAAVPSTFRIVYDGDVVAGVPMAVFLYRHVGTEIVIDRHGNTIVDPTFVEQTFRAKGKRRIEAHLCLRYEEATTACLRQVAELAAERHGAAPLDILHQLNSDDIFSESDLISLAGLCKNGDSQPVLAVHDDEVQNIAQLANGAPVSLLSAATLFFARKQSLRTDCPFDADDLVSLYKAQRGHGANQNPGRADEWQENFGEAPNLGDMGRATDSFVLGIDSELTLLVSQDSSVQ